MLDSHRFRLHKKLSKSLQGIFKDQSLEKRLPGGHAKESMVLVFCHINANDQILLRFPNLFFDKGVKSALSSYRVTSLNNSVGGAKVCARNGGPWF
jgi:hypothetical protein